MSSLKLMSYSYSFIFPRPERLAYNRYTVGAQQSFFIKFMNNKKRVIQSCNKIILIIIGSSFEWPGTVLRDLHGSNLLILKTDLQGTISTHFTEKKKLKHRDIK